MRCIRNDYVFRMTGSRDEQKETVVEKPHHNPKKDVGVFPLSDSKVNGVLPYRPVPSPSRPFLSLVSTKSTTNRLHFSSNGLIKKRKLSEQTRLLNYLVNLQNLNKKKSISSHPNNVSMRRITIPNPKLAWVMRISPVSWFIHQKVGNGIKEGENLRGHR